MVILGFTYHCLLLLLFNHQVMSDSATPWTAACQVSLPLTIFRSLLKFMSIELVKLSTISSSSAPFSFCLQSFPASESFPMSWFFALGSQSIGTSASASVLPMSTQGWFPLGKVYHQVILYHFIFNVRSLQQYNSIYTHLIICAIAVIYFQYLCVSDAENNSVTVYIPQFFLTFQNWKTDLLCCHWDNYLSMYSFSHLSINSPDTILCLWE